MELYTWIFDGEKYQKNSVIDFYSSLIWTQKFNSAGDFEVYLPADKELLTLFSQNEILITRENTDSCMIPERIELTTDDENGDHLIISGCSSEGLLRRRICPSKRTYRQSAETTIRSLIINNMLLPNIGIRQFKLLRLAGQHDYPEMLDIQITGEKLHDTISNICSMFSYGFKMPFDGEFFTFDLYKGLNQIENSYVIFSPDFENLGDTSFVYDKTDMANSVYAIGEETEQYTVIRNIMSSSATNFLTLKEKWIDASDISAQTDEGEMSQEDYEKLLNAKINEELENSKEQKSYSGEILNTDVYEFGKDYYLGDKVSIVNTYGIKGTATVTEVTEVDDAEGYRLMPTFSDWEVD